MRDKESELMKEILQSEMCGIIAIYDWFWEKYGFFYYVLRSISKSAKEFGWR